MGGMNTPPGNPESPFNVTSEWTGQTLLLGVSGEVDLLTAPKMEEALTEGLEHEPDTLVIDLLSVSFLSSAGLSTLVRCNQLAGEKTRCRVVAEGAATLRPIELMGLDNELDIYPSRETALAAPAGQ